MQRVVLLGELGQKFGETWDMNVNYINEKWTNCKLTKKYVLAL